MTLQVLGVLVMDKRPSSGKWLIMLWEKSPNLEYEQNLLFVVFRNKHIPMLWEEVDDHRFLGVDQQNGLEMHHWDCLQKWKLS